MTTLRVSALEKRIPRGEFASDVLRVLAAYAKACALDLSFRPDPADPAAFLAELPDGELPFIARFGGIHRAQVIPAESPAGRVSTLRVAVDLLDGAGPHLARRAASVAFTYGYPSGVVTEHRTGRQYCLRDFLEGRAG